MEASRDISVIVAIHDAPEVTSRCLKSLECYGSNAEVILVNDGSRLQETLELIEYTARQNGWQIIAHAEGLGHSRACESGSKVASRKYLCFLNSDTVITPWSWASVKEVFESGDKIAVVGPSTSWAWTGQAVPRAMHCRAYWNDNQIYNFAKEYVSKQARQSWVDLPEISGFAFFIRRSVWKEVHGFDYELVGYGNETELCKRLLRLGYRLVWTRNSYIHHFGRGTFDRIQTKEQIRHQRSAAERYIEDISKGGI